MDLTTLFGVGLISSILSQFPWCLLLQFTYFRMYTLKKSDECKQIQRNLTNSSHISDDGKRVGYSFGKWFVLFMQVDSGFEGDGDKYTIWLIATTKSYEQLTKKLTSDTLSDEGGDSVQTSINTICLWKRLGGLYTPYFKKRSVSVKTVLPRLEQMSIMDDIQKHYSEYGHATAFIHGQPGTGKSIIGILLANVYESGYCNMIHPWTPGVTLSQLYDEDAPTPEKPLIVMFDEVDVALLRIHSEIPNHKCLSTEIKNKTDWNKLFDEIDLGLYPNLIIVMTSNKCPSFINALDTCYIRPGRVNIIREMLTKNE